MNLKFENKTALVSASTAGIGFAIALEPAWVFVSGPGAGRHRQHYLREQAFDKAT